MTTQWSLDAGRCIVKDGKPLATLHGVNNYDPCELDALARWIVSALQLKSERDSNPSKKQTENHRRDLSHKQF
jgi:hypothetical protein